MFEIVNTNTFDCHFIFFISPFQTHCFRNFNPESPGVKPLLILINITHQKLLNTYQSNSFYQSSSAMIHVDSFVYIRMFFLENCMNEKNFCRICGEFSFRIWSKKVCKMLLLFVTHRNKFRKYSWTFIYKESFANVL